MNHFFIFYIKFKQINKNKNIEMGIGDWGFLGYAIYIIWNQMKW